MTYTYLLLVNRLKLNPRSPIKHGKVWGVYYWNHRQIGKETKIGGVHKKQWLLDAEQPQELSVDQRRTMLRPAALAMKAAAEKP